MKPKPAQHYPVSAAVVQKRRQINFDFKVGILIALTLVLLKVVLADTRPVRYIDQLTCAMLQAPISWFRPHSDKLPLVVLDISKAASLEVKRNPDGSEKITSRVKLFDLLSAIGESDPIGIAIDIDLFPKNITSVESKTTVDFLTKCSRKFKIPIIGGAYGTNIPDRNESP